LITLKITYLQAVQEKKISKRSLITGEGVVEKECWYGWAKWRSRGRERRRKKSLAALNFLKPNPMVESRIGSLGFEAQL